VAGALLAHKFGRTAATDGFMAAYGFYIVLTLGAQSFRLVVVPDLTRAAAEGRLGGELRAYGAAFLAAAVPVCVVVVALAHPLGELVTGSLPDPAASTAAHAVVWLVPAAFGQLLAAIAVSGLAARDRYGVAALGYSSGGIAGLVVFVVLADTHGLVALAWGLAANAALSLGLPLAALVLSGELRGPRPLRWALGGRLWRLLEGAAVPLALQGFYVLALRLAAALGVGRVTSLSYAYLIVATLSYVPAFSISLVSSAPLTRRGLDEDAAAEHVLHASWLSLVLVGGAAGVFALVGGRLVELVLGGAYAGDVGTQLGHLVVELAPWMVGSVAFYVTFPLIFVAERRRWLVPLALVSLVFDALISLGLREAAGMLGICLGMAIATIAVVAVLMASISSRLLALAAAGVGRLSLVVLVAAAAAFGIFAAVLAPIPAAVAGTLGYALLLALAAKRFGLGDAWAYVRALH